MLLYGPNICGFIPYETMVSVFFTNHDSTQTLTMTYTQKYINPYDYY